jgi:hypothetical protein
MKQQNVSSPRITSSTVTAYDQGCAVLWPIHGPLFASTLNKLGLLKQREEFSQIPLSCNLAER